MFVLFVSPQRFASLGSDEHRRRLALRRAEGAEGASVIPETMGVCLTGKGYIYGYLRTRKQMKKGVY
jgi:hypothetical protein